MVPAASLDLRQTRGGACRKGCDAAPHGVMPPSFPVFSKPITNLRGMGTGSQVIDSAERVQRGADRRAFLVHAADRRACQHRCRAGGRRAALVAAHHRAPPGRAARSTTG